MTKTVLWTLAAATMLSSVTLAGEAIAMTQSTAPALAVAAPALTPAAANMRLAAIVCGNVGCAPVQTKPPQRRKLRLLGHKY